MTTNKELGLTVCVAAKEKVAESIVRFELVSTGGVVLPAAEAGAHIQVEVPDGQIRKYSLCQGPDVADRYIITVKREDHGKGGSRSLIDESAIGTQLRISAPINDFAMKGNPTRYLFIAGGIGITPIYSMMRTLMETGGKPFKLYYLTRSPEQTAFLNELKSSEYHGKVIVHHDQGDPDKAYDLWPVLEQPRGAYLYCCGPRGLMMGVRDMTGHWPGSSVHFEDFGQGDVAHQSDDRPFRVRIADNSDTLEVPADKSILEVLRLNDYKVPSSCESGTCGTCRCKLIEGKADHRDLVLSDDEKSRYIMICVSRAAGDELVIELPE
jgi:phthalate 4,5-dioxygenase reductase component